MDPEDLIFTDFEKFLSQLFIFHGQWPVPFHVKEKEEFKHKICSLVQAKSQYADLLLAWLTGLHAHNGTTIGTFLQL